MISNTQDSKESFVRCAIGQVRKTHKNGVWQASFGKFLPKLEGFKDEMAVKWSLPPLALLRSMWMGQLEASWVQSAMGSSDNDKGGVSRGFLQSDTHQGVE